MEDNIELTLGILSYFTQVGRDTRVAVSTDDLCHAFAPPHHYQTVLDHLAHCTNLQLLTAIANSSGGAQGTSNVRLLYVLTEAGRQYFALSRRTAWRDARRSIEAKRAKVTTEALLAELERVAASPDD